MTDLNKISTEVLLEELKARQDYTHIAGYTDEELEELLIHNNIIKTALSTFKNDIKNNYFLKEEFESEFIVGIANSMSLKDDELCKVFAEELANQIKYKFDDFHYALKKRETNMKSGGGMSIITSEMTFIDEMDTFVAVFTVYSVDDKIKIAFSCSKNSISIERVKPSEILKAEALGLDMVSDVAEEFYNQVFNN